MLESLEIHRKISYDIKIDGKLYYDTGKESTASYRCGNMDGIITSTVDGTEIPTENNPSNFGSGFGYQYGEEDAIEIRGCLV